MNDTTPDMERLVAARFAAMSSTERVHIAVQMCRTSRRIVESSLQRDQPLRDFKRELCERLYGDLALLAFPHGSPR